MAHQARSQAAASSVRACVHVHTFMCVYNCSITHILYVIAHKCQNRLCRATKSTLQSRNAFCAAQNMLHAHTFLRTRQRTYISMRRQLSVRSRRCQTHAALRRVTILVEAPGPSQTKGLAAAECGAAPTLSLCYSDCIYTAFFNCSRSVPIAAVLHFHESASRCLHQAHF